MPKRGNTDLYDLIRSLTAQEKRYYKTSSNSSKSLPVHIRLFNILHSQKIYNEAAACKALQINSLRYANVKKYLNRSILQSLRSYHQEKAYRSSVRELFDEYDILFNKNLYSQAEKTLSKAIQLSLRYDLHALTMEGYRYYYQLKIEQSDIKWVKKNIKTLFKNIDLASQKFNNLIGYLKNETDIILFLSTYGDVVRSKSAEKSLHQMKKGFIGLQNESQALSMDTRRRYNFQRGVIAYLEKNPRKSVDYFMKSKRLADTGEVRVQQNFKGYISLISNIFSAGIGHLSYSELKKILVNIGSFRKYWLPENHETLTAYYTNLMYLHIYYHKYNETIPLLQEINEWSKRIGKEDIDRKGIYLHYYATTCYFFNGNYEDALFRINRIINAPQLVKSPHIYSTIKMVNIIIHFERNSDSDLLLSLIHSLERYFMKSKIAFKTELAVLGFFNHILKSNHTKSELYAEFIQLQRDIEELMKNPKEEWANKEFDYLYWIEMHIMKLKS